MNFLEKLDMLMNEQNLNKKSFSSASGIPYTTIVGWYKKGYDDLRLGTLKKLAAYFNTSLDYWAYDSDDKEMPNNKLSIEKQNFIKDVSNLDDNKFHLIHRIVKSVLNESEQ